LENKITGRESQGACHQDEMIGGELWFWLDGNVEFRLVLNTGFRLQESVTGHISIASPIPVVIFQIYQITISILSQVTSSTV
jgi:hypothetical protein